jgi:hypothetical protein
MFMMMDSVVSISSVSGLHENTHGLEQGRTCARAVGTPKNAHRGTRTRYREMDREWHTGRGEYTAAEAEGRKRQTHPLHRKTVHTDTAQSARGDSTGSTAQHSTAQAITRQTHQKRTVRRQTPQTERLSRGVAQH